MIRQRSVGQCIYLTVVGLNLILTNTRKPKRGECIVKWMVPIICSSKTMCNEGAQEFVC